MLLTGRSGSVWSVCDRVQGRGAAIIERLRQPLSACQIVISLEEPLHGSKGTSVAVVGSRLQPDSMDACASGFHFRNQRDPTTPSSRQTKAVTPNIGWMPIASASIPLR